MKQDRRGWALAAGVAAAATAAGIGWAVWRQRGTDGGVERALWSSSFDTPDGTRLAMASLRGHPVVLNFWATWCPPCVREMPALDRFAREHAARGWRVVGLAADKPEPVREFLARTPVSYAIGLTGFAGVELSRGLGNLAGGLPFTVLFDRDARLLQRHMGETSFDQLTDWARASGST
jgi:thiol-disulfide isomerase/thioredoxin